jgi:hypothetical protein
MSMIAHLHSCVGPKACAWLLVHPTTHTFCLFSIHFLTTLCIHFGLPHPMVPIFHGVNVVIALMTYQFALMPLREWMYSDPRYILGYCCNYCFWKWSTCLKRGFPPFISSHLMTSGNFYQTTFGPWWTLWLSIQLTQIWCNEHQWQQYM